MRHPLAVARPHRRPDAASMNVGKGLRETGVPLAPALRMRPGDIAGVLDNGAEACGAHHGAVRAAQTPCGDVIPSRVFEVLMEQIADAGRIHVASLNARALDGLVSFLA